MPSSDSNFMFPCTCDCRRKMVPFAVLVFIASCLMFSDATSSVSSSSTVTPPLSAGHLQTSSLAQAVYSSSPPLSSALLAATSFPTTTASITEVQTVSALSSSLAATRLPAATTASTAQAQTVSRPSSSLANPISPSSSSASLSISASVAVDPCKQNNRGCAHNCVKNGTKYSCSCDSGFKLESDLHNCTDLDECNSTTGRHKCEHICVNTVGSYACACRPGYKLGMNGLSCTESTTASPRTIKAKTTDQWNWIILGIVIGLVVFNVLFLVAGVFAKRIVDSKRGKEGIAEENRKMTTIKPTAVGSANAGVEVET